MPIYEYRCSACGHELEAIQKFSDAPLTQCPSCHAATLVKLVSAAGFQLKGSGWYVTDFRGGGAKPAGKADNGAKTGSGESKTEAAAESKPETKSESKTETAAPAKPAASTSGSQGS